MEAVMFHKLVQCLTPRLTKADTNFRKALEKPRLKLAITLLLLAYGNGYHSLAYAFKVFHNTMSVFLGEVFDAIIAGH